MPRPRKAFGEAADPRNGARLVLNPPTIPDPPPAPKGMLAATARSWTAFWRSEAAALVLAADLPALERLFELRDERTRCMRAARKARVVAGSTGQPSLNPLYRHVSTLDGEIRQLEDRFGLAPLSRLRLGVTFGEAARSLADLNAAAAGAAPEEDHDDPRHIA